MVKRKIKLTSLIGIIVLLICMMISPEITVYAEDENTVVDFNQVSSYLDELGQQAETLGLNKKYTEYVTKAQEIIDNYSGQEYVRLKETDKLFKSSYLEISQKSAGVYYYGEIKNNRPSGKGILVNKTNENYPYIYVGEFSKGVMSGIGFEVSEYYEGGVPNTIGKYKNGKKNGICLGSSGDTVQDSNYKKGKMNGNAKQYYKGVLIYDTNMKNDKMNGKGKAYYQNGNIKYEGNFKNGEYNGKGKLYNENGELIYSGKFKNGDYTS